MIDKNRITLETLRESFLKKEELKETRKEPKSAKEVRVGCKTYGMVKKSEKEPCDEPRCQVCRNRKNAVEIKKQEDLIWEARRESREVKGFYHDAVDSVQELTDSKEPVKESSYAFVSSGSKLQMYVFLKGKWEITKEEK